MQLGEGVDDETWQYHLRQGDYGRWFRDIIKDQDLAQAADRMSRNGDVSPKESRRQLFNVIRKKYEKQA
jgi:hypothetical protein